MKIKALLLILVVIFALFCNISCSKNREYDEAEVISAAQTLIKKSEILNDIYYGYGIGYEMNESEAVGAYYRADFFSAQKFGVETIEDIKDLTYDCFTVSYSNSIISTKLSSVSDESGIQGYARYYQKYNALDDSEECIMVYKYAEVYLVDEVVYDYATIRAIGSVGDEVFVEIDVEVTTPDKKMQTQTVKISLLEESNGWRINSPTYVKYVDRDYYNDLQNKK
jgi:hypothetical protein